MVCAGEAALPEKRDAHEEIRKTTDEVENQRAGRMFSGAPR
jgi:hypothetical protein